MKSRKFLKLTLFAVVLSIAVSSALYMLPFHLEDSLAQFSLYSWWAGPLVYMAWEFIATLIPPLPNPISAVFAGYFFGVIPGFVYTVLANMAGSALLFFIGRYGKEALALRFIKKERQLEKVNSFLNREHGLYSLILIRFSPLFPNDVLTLFLGFTEITFTRFIVTTTLGYAVPFLVLAYAGSLLSAVGGDVTQASVLPIFVLLTVISVVGLVPVALKLARRRIGKR